MHLITESTITVVDSWKSLIETQGGTADIKIDEYMRSFSGDVISRACFGSNYSEGEEIFVKLRTLQGAMSKKSFSTGVPGMRYYELFFYEVHNQYVLSYHISLIIHCKIDSFQHVYVTVIFPQKAIGKHGG